MDDNPYRSPTTSGQRECLDAIQPERAWPLQWLIALRILEWGCFIVGGNATFEALFKVVPPFTRFALAAGAAACFSVSFFVAYRFSRIRKNCRTLSLREKSQHGAAYLTAAGICQIAFGAYLLSDGSTDQMAAMIIVIGGFSLLLASVIHRRGRQLPAAPV